MEIAVFLLSCWGMSVVDAFFFFAFRYGIDVQVHVYLKQTRHGTLHNKLLMLDAPESYQLFVSLCTVFPVLFVSFAFPVWYQVSSSIDFDFPRFVSDT